jgi:hypothetical protein
MTLIQCALAACSLNHRDAFTSVMKFFRDLIYLPSQQDLVSYLSPPSSLPLPLCLPPSCLLLHSHCSLFLQTADEYQARVSIVQAFLNQNGQLLVDG